MRNKHLEIDQEKARSGAGHAILLQHAMHEVRNLISVYLGARPWIMQ